MRIRASGRSPTADPRRRGALLMPACVLAVHQIRYALAFGGHASGRLAQQGHAYLTTIEPFVLLLAAVAGGAFLGRLSLAWQSGPLDRSARELDGARTRRTLLGAWIACALALLAIYGLQELVEGALAPGHPAGLAGVFGSGGWIAVPAALAIGGALATALNCAERLVRLAARRAAALRLAIPAASPSRPHQPVVRNWRLDPACGIAAGRAPPVLLRFR